MRKIGLAVLVLALAALTATNVWAATNTSNRVSYPANCTKVVTCVTNHLDNLDARLHRQHTQILNLTNELNNAWARISCYGTMGVAEYPAGQNPGNWGSIPPGADSGEGSTYLDLAHNDNPAFNQVYHVVVNYC